MNAFSIRECLSFGWNTFKDRPLTYIAATLIVGVIQTVTSGIQQGMSEPFLGFLVSLVVSTLLYCGILHFFIKAHDAPKEVQLRDLWYPKAFLRYLLLSLLLGVIVGIGLVLLIVPGVILALVFFCAGYLVIDKGMQPLAALRKSAAITRGSRYRLFLLVIVMLLLFIVGMLPLFLGLLVVAPVIALAGVHAYRALLLKEGVSSETPATVSSS